MQRNIESKSFACKLVSSEAILISDWYWKQNKFDYFCPFWACWFLLLVIICSYQIGWGDSKGSNNTLMDSELLNMTGAQTGAELFLQHANFSAQGLLMEEGTRWLCQCSINIVFLHFSHFKISFFAVVLLTMACVIHNVK